MTLQQAMLVGTGGFLGAVARWGVAGKWGAPPWDILVINFLGSFLIGVVWAWPEAPGRDGFRQFLAAGFCGSFTTFSTFSWQTVDLLKDGRFLSAGLNIALSVVLCILGVCVGTVLAQRIA